MLICIYVKQIQITEPKQTNERTNQQQRKEQHETDNTDWMLLWR